MNMSWEYCKIGDILSVERGGSPRPIEKYLTNSPDGLNWIKIGDATASNRFIEKTKEKIIKEGLKKSRFVDVGDFLLSNSMSFGRPYIMKTNGCIHDGWLVLKDKKVVELDKNFLYYILCSPNIFEQFDKLAAGSTVRNLNISLVSSVKIPVPPLSTQKCVVSILDNAFFAIDKAKSNIEKNIKCANELFQSRLKKIVSQKCENWEERKLGDLCYTITDGKHGDCENKENSGYYFLSAKDVFNDTLNYQKARQITKKDFDETHKRTDLKPGDVLITNSGTIGRMALAPNDEKTYKTTFQKSVAIVKPRIDVLNNDFCRYILEADLDKLVNISAGTAQKNLLISDLKKHVVYLPSIEEQKRIVIHLDEFRKYSLKLCKQYQIKIELIEELKKTLLQKAFAGELT